MPRLTENFVEERLTSLPAVPEDWGIPPAVHCYQLNLRRCQLKDIQYEFSWGKNSHKLDDNQPKSVTTHPDKIIKLTLSMNELTSLEIKTFSIFMQLRHVDASLNQLTSIQGLETLSNLRVLNLSYNQISDLTPMRNCKELRELNIAFNKIRNLQELATLSNLRVLHINENEVTNLDGIQSLGQLTELHAHNNKVDDILPLSSSFQLVVLNISNNRVSSLRTSLEILQNLENLDNLSCEGNPITSDMAYQDAIVNETTITLLDNVPVSRPKKIEKEIQRNIHLPMYDTIRKKFMEHVQQEKKDVQEKVDFLQRKIRSLENDYRHFETKTWADMDRALTKLSKTALETKDLTMLETAENSASKDNEKLKISKFSKHQPDTDEVLREVMLKLVEEKKK